LRKLGIIGGMSWVSTATYYDRINRIVQKRAAPKASAPLLIESLDFCQLYALTAERDWQRAAAGGRGGRGADHRRQFDAPPV